MKKEQKVTIHMIAEQLNVSAITVSRALANQPGVSDELRQKIISTAKELGYKRCRQNVKASILFLIRRRYVADHSNFSQLVEGIEANAARRGSDLTIEFVDYEMQQNLTLPQNLDRSGKRFDGVILLGKFEDKYAARIQQVVPSLVMINGGYDTVKCSYVYYNFSRIGYMAAQYLVRKGHTAIGFVGAEPSYSHELRYFGITRALAEHRLELNKRFLLNSRGDLEAQVKQLIREKVLPTAFICQSDRTALRLVKILHENDIHVPKDVSIIGSGNTEMSSISIPALTTFETNIPVVCEIAVNTLLEQINGSIEVGRTIFVDAELVERESVRNLNGKEAEQNGLETTD